MSSTRTILEGQIFEHSETVTLEELGTICSVERRALLELVDEGVLKMESEGALAGRLRTHTVRHTRIALRLQRDLGVNAAGAALALQLLQEIEFLHRQLKRLR